ncbi:helix-turn-helix domain-containing protein [Microbacterium sp. HMH0099]|uniref:AraC family transcriptional regulator n=1 Tax=Microbacterium sp. HMH0099 TaxID=3414026 RepID=UPI003BF7464F
MAVVSDEMVGAHYVARRVWHTPALLIRAPRAARPGETLQLLVQVAGEATVRLVDDDLSLAPGDMVLSHGSGVASLRNTAPTARIELALPRPATVASTALRVLPAADESLVPTMLTSMVNAVLNVEASPPLPVVEELQNVLGATVALLAVERDPPREAVAAGERLYRDAMAHIRTWGHSPAVTVTSLVAAMNVSRQHLARVFAARDTTPGAELRRHRASAARHLLMSGLMDAADAAPASGFSSVRAMQRALRAFESSAPDEERPLP